MVASPDDATAGPTSHATSSFLLQRVPLARPGASRPHAASSPRVGGVYRSGTTTQAWHGAGTGRHADAAPPLRVASEQRPSVNRFYDHVPCFAEVAPQEEQKRDPLDQLFPWQARDRQAQPQPQPSVGRHPAASASPQYATRVRDANQLQVDRVSDRLASSLDAFVQQRPDHRRVTSPRTPVTYTPHRVPPRAQDAHYPSPPPPLSTPGAVRLGQGAVHDTRSPNPNFIEVGDDDTHRPPVHSAHVGHSALSPPRPAPAGPATLPVVDPADELDVDSVVSMLRQANVLRPRPDPGFGPIKIVPVDLQETAAAAMAQAAQAALRREEQLARPAADPTEPIVGHATESSSSGGSSSPEAVDDPSPRLGNGHVVREPSSDRNIPLTDEDNALVWPPPRRGEVAGRFPSRAPAASLPPTDHHHLVNPVTKRMQLREGNFDIKYTATPQGIFIDELVPGGAAERAGVPNHGRLARLNGLNINNVGDLTAAKELADRQSRLGGAMHHEIVVDVGVERPPAPQDAAVHAHSLEGELGRMVTAAGPGERLVKLVRSHPSLSCDSAAEVGNYYRIAGQQGVVTDVDSSDRTVFVEFASVDLQAWLPLTAVEEHNKTAVSLKLPLGSSDDARREVGRRPARDQSPGSRVQHNYATAPPQQATSRLDAPVLAVPHEKVTIRDPHLANSSLPLVDPLEEIDAIPAPADNLRVILNKPRHREGDLTPAPAYRRNYSPERMAVETAELVDSLRLVPYVGMESPSPSPEASPISDLYVDGDERVLPEQLSLDAEEFLAGEETKTFPQYGFDHKADGVYLQDYGMADGERGKASREDTLFPPPFYPHDDESEESESSRSSRLQNQAAEEADEETQEYKRKLEVFQKDMADYFQRVGEKKYRDFVSDMVYKHKCPPELTDYYRNQLDRMDKGKGPFKSKKVSISEPHEGESDSPVESKSEASDKVDKEKDDKDDKEDKDEKPKKKKKKKGKSDEAASDKEEEQAAPDSEGDKAPEKSDKKRKKKDLKPPPQPSSDAKDGKKDKPDKSDKPGKPAKPDADAADDASSKKPPAKKPSGKKAKKDAKKPDPDSPAPDEKAKPKKPKEAKAKDKPDDDDETFQAELKAFDKNMADYYKRVGAKDYQTHLQGLKDGDLIPPERAALYDEHLKLLKEGKPVTFNSKKKAKAKPKKGGS